MGSTNIYWASTFGWKHDNSFFKQCSSSLSLLWHFYSYPDEGRGSQRWPAVFPHSTDMAGIWAQTSHSHQHVTCPVSMWVMDGYLETSVVQPGWLPSAGAISVWCPLKSRTLMLFWISTGGWKSSWHVCLKSFLIFYKLFIFHGKEIKC